MSLMGSGGGGGGFGGFPYRSAHQQGNDRRSGRSNRAPQRRKPSKQQPPRLRLLYNANIFLSPDRRGRLIGTGGRIIKSLTEATQCSIHVPKRNQNSNSTDNNITDVDIQSAVHVKAPEISNLLHACWKIAQLALSGNEDDTEGQDAVKCQLRLGLNTNSSLLDGKLVNGPNFLTISTSLEQLQQPVDDNDNDNDNSNHHHKDEISAYCIQIDNNNVCGSDQIPILVDNARFANPELQVTEYAIATENNNDGHVILLVFVYGEANLSRRLYDALLKMIRDVEPSSRGESMP